MKNYQKEFAVIFGILLICGVILYTFYMYKKEVEPVEIPVGSSSEISSTTKEEITPSIKTQSLEIPANSSIDDRLKKIFETKRSAGEIVDLDTYIVSPDNKYLLVKYFIKRGETVYFFYNLETNTEIPLSWDEYYGQNALTEILWKTDESYALLPTQWGAYGGDAFTGIFKIDLENGKFTRLIDKGADCAQEEYWYDCLYPYVYILEKIEGSTLYYTERVYKKGTSIDEGLYVDERKTLIIK